MESNLNEALLILSVKHFTLKYSYNMLTWSIGIKHLVVDSAYLSSKVINVRDCLGSFLKSKEIRCCSDI